MYLPTISTESTCIDPINFRLKLSNVVDWPLWAPGTNLVHIHTCKQNIIVTQKNLKNFKSVFSG